MAETYDLCGDHADRTRPPFGWSLKDDRPEEVPVDTPDVADLSSARTVAVLAAALRGAPDEPGDAAQVDVDTAALDAIVDQPFDDPSGDLYGTVDETDPVTDHDSRAPADQRPRCRADQPGPPTTTTTTLTCSSRYRRAPCPGRTGRTEPRAPTRPCGRRPAGRCRCPGRVAPPGRAGLPE